MSALDQLPTVRFETMEETVYRVLRQSILRGKLAPGERLIQEELAEYFGCSRIPARDALKRLEADGLVSAEVKGRFSVVAFTEREVQEIFDLRTLVEPYAARTAIELMDEGIVGKLRELNASMRTALEEEAIEELTDLNYMFHMTLYRTDLRDRLGRILSGLWFARPQAELQRMSGYLAVSLDEHDQMIEHAEATEGDALAAAVEHHVERARERLEQPLLSADAVVRGPSVDG